MSEFLSIKDFVKRQISGDWGKAEIDEKNNTEVYCIRGADINAVNEGNYTKLPIRYIESKNRNKFLQEGNIIVEVSGGSPTQSTGRASYVRSLHTNIICSNFCRAFEIKDDFSPKYFYYLLKNIYNSNVFFNFESKTTGIKNLLLDLAFDNIKVPKTDLPTQQKIASVLSALDDKIELNNKINDNLKHTAKTIYDYWFVQFDFPDKNGKPYKSSGGSLVYNEFLKRDIPLGWEVKEIHNLLAKNDNTKKISASEYLQFGQIPIIDQSTNYIAGYTNDIEFKVEIKEIPAIIFGDHTRILKLINFDFARGADGTQIIFSKENRMPQYLFYYTLCKIDLSNYGYARHFKFLKESKVVVPDEKIAQIFNNKMKVFYQKILFNELQNQQLTQLRDFLLPMLMNGQVKIE